MLKEVEKGSGMTQILFQMIFVVSVKEMDFIGKESGRDRDEKGCYCNYPIEIGW